MLDDMLLLMTSAVREVRHFAQKDILFLDNQPVIPCRIRRRCRNPGMWECSWRVNIQDAICQLHG